MNGGSMYHGGAPPVDHIGESYDEDDDNQTEERDLVAAVQLPVEPAAGNVPAAPFTAAQLIANARVANQALIRETATCDRTYTLKYSVFKSFVDQQRLSGILADGPTYFTDENVDLFFLLVVAQLTTLTPRSALRYKYGLTHYARLEGYNMERPTIAEAYAAQKAGFLDLRDNGGGVATPGRPFPDPHSNRRTDILSEEENRRVVYAILQRDDWKRVYPTWTMCEQTMLRGKSSQVLTICHLYRNCSHGPYEGRDCRSRKPMTEIILEPGLHKTGKGDTLKRSTGMLPHKEWLLDGEFALGITLLMRLFLDESDLHFYRDHDPSKQPDWQQMKAIEEFGSDTGLYNAYKSLLGSLGLSWAKVTHLRTWAIEYASKHGLTRGEIASMSKHVISSLDDCYVTELAVKVLQVMAGIDKDDVYDIKRLKTQLPYNVTVDDIVKCFCPRIEQWRTQQASPLGDNLNDLVAGKTSAAYHFLHMYLPHICLRVFQTSIYVIHELPNHEMTHFIIARLPDWFHGWAAQERIRLDAIRHAELQSNVINMDPGARQGYYECKDQIYQTNQGLQDLVSKHGEIKGLLTNLITRMDSSPLQANVATVSPAPQQPAARGFPVPVAGGGLLVSPRRGFVSVPNNAVANVPPEESTDPFLNHSLPLPPPHIGASLPTTFVLLWQQHIDHRLGRYAKLKGRRQHWQKGLAQRLNRRLLLFAEVERVASGLGSHGGVSYLNHTWEQKLEIAAKLLSNRHKEKSLPAVLKHLRKDKIGTRDGKRRASVARQAAAARREADRRDASGQTE